MDPTNDNTRFRGARAESNQSGSPAQCSAHNVMSAPLHSPEREYQCCFRSSRRVRVWPEAFHIVDPKLRERHLQRLASAGIDVAAAEQSGAVRAAQLG